jgi:long-subunit fatty acid transport protein
MKAMNNTNLMPENLMKKFLIILFMIIITAPVSLLKAQSLNKVGTSAGQFLKLGLGARAIGMGGAYSTMEGDINSIYWNPAGIARIENRAASFSHVDWFMDVNYDFAAFATQMQDFGTVGVSAAVLSMDDMPVRTVEEPLGTGEYFSAGSIMVALSYARNLTDNFSIGFNAKYVREYIWNESASGFAFDIGTIYSIPILNGFRIGANISNFGSKMKLQGRDLMLITTVGSGLGNIINTDYEVDEYDLPLTMRIGVAADPLKMDEHKITVAIDAVHPNDNKEYVNAGAEYSWNNIVFLRGGYKTLFMKDSEEGLTFGFGLKYRVMETLKLAVDYAYQDFNRMKNVHYFTVGVEF